MAKKQQVVYLLLGGNLHDVKHTFELARIQLEKLVGDVIQVSHLYKSKAWGFESDNEFLNQVIVLRSYLTAEELLLEIQKIELDLGRHRTKGLKGFESRIIDIDILYYNTDIISNSNLTIPHYALHQRNFTLEPLVEIAPNFMHPILKKSNQTLLEECADKSIVTKI
tara:strand:+ start:35846 stop:36346 length:501 start_codon:yes stop_codon:yes gene_type:complete